MGGSIARLVGELVSRDSVATEAVARRIVNYRARARWLIGKYELDATEEAVMAAIRRAKRAPSRANSASACSALLGADVDDTNPDELALDPIGDRAPRPRAASVSERVHAMLDSDVAARDILKRGALGLRPFARWLLHSPALAGATEDAVLSALRRYDPHVVDKTDRTARAILQRSQLTVRSGVYSFVLPKGPDARKAAAALLNEMDPGTRGVIRVIDAHNGLTLIVDRPRIADVRRSFGDSHVRRVNAELVELSIAFPPAAQCTPGVLSPIFSALAAHGVNVVEQMAGPHEQVILVGARDAQVSLDLLRRLIDGVPPGLRESPIR